MASARITGFCLGSTRRRGKSTKTGDPYDLSEATVLIAGSDVVKVSYFTDNDTDVALSRGDLVDLLVTVGMFRGEPQFNAVGPWPEDAEASSLAVAVALSGA